ncbi:Gfo/Idh/MocA family oxidoreductase [Paenibacillus filicis]|uniref:Gfo/Idh/MocA family oxidoreductase n=1 Tax=Paenibacillus gyeongsangnamensis TaxID=3388067 RepID=A0ABT4QHX2_9BACL|nr:Gfo/Idh/MocA family oxidoreductase [Paenibacillus filicis]MCZ8516418.1 Gfo/Idh/MocA family oxidoreductase [Paenibacillus filicis]
MIRVAMLSFWHVHAKDYARQASEHPDTEIVAVWDELPERGRKEAEARGARFYESLEELLAQKDIDAVIVDTPTNVHRDVMVAAARAGKHIFTEKVVATTLKECNEILNAVESAGVRLTVSLPRLNADYTAAVQKIIGEGLLGELTLVRTRLSHNGAISTAERPGGWLPAHFFGAEQCGGGAMIDLGCHPMYLARLFLGLPESVSANYGYVTGKEVEDNAVSVLRYPSGALAVVEAGFVNRFSPFVIEVHGTEGSLLYSTHDNKLLVRSSKLDGQTEWTVEKELSANRPSAFDQWVSHIQNGTTASENIALAADLTRLMEASNLSARAGAPVLLNDLQP